MSTSRSRLATWTFWNTSDFDALDDIIHPDYRARRGDRLMASGAAALKAWLSGLHTIFPDMKYTVEEILTADDRVVVRASGIGTHLGEWRNNLFTIPPTGRRVTWSGVDLIRVADRKIIEDLAALRVVLVAAQVRMGDARGNGSRRTVR